MTTGKASLPSQSSMFGENEKVLQAVVIADSFNERFMPVTLDRPRCLLPLVNVPIIEYTFEFLAVSGVQEVILFCRSHSDQIKQYISKSRWCKATSTMNIQIIVNNECISVGDAIRDVDSRSIIHGDFILVCGDVVSNMNLSEALQNHRQRRKVDRNYILTMILKETSPFHRSRERCESGVFAIDNSNGECIAYESIDSENVKEVSLPLLSKLASIKELSIRYDLMDCQIDICSLNVLALFTENFDYQDVRRDFLKGILTSDILGSRVATHILTNEYASRVRSPHLYDSISKDIVERWVFPIVPEADLLEEQPYIYRRGNQYLGPEVVLSRSAILGNNVVLGTGVSIGENSIVTNSVIGSNCQIGADVSIENSYIWNNTIIEDGCRISQSILADQVRILSNTKINYGCLITSDITLGPKGEIPPRTRIAKLGEHVDLSIRQLSISEGDGANDVITERQKCFGGKGSDAIVWDVGSVGGGSLETVNGGGGNFTISINEDETKDPMIQEEKRAAFDIGGEYHCSRPTFSDVESELDLDFDGDNDNDNDNDNEEEHKGNHHHYHHHSHAHSHDDDSIDEYDKGGINSNSYGRNSSKFFRDAFDLMKHAIETNYLLDNALLEINGLKFACNATFSECRQVVLKALYSFIDLQSMAKSIDKLFLKWAPILSRFTQGIEEQVDLIDTVQKVCLENPGLERSFQFIIPVLYKTDVLEEDSVVSWFERNVQSNSLFVRQIRGFVQWLQQEEEEDDGDDDDEDEDGQGNKEI